MIPLIVFLIFVFVWYFPVWCKQGKTCRPSRWMIPTAILSGMIPVTIALLLLQFGLGHALKAMKLPQIAGLAFDAYICAALVEEGVKFLAACLLIRAFKPQRKVDYVLVFGAVGLGYEITETLMMLNSVATGIFRGVFALHIIWQFCMGLFYWEYCQAKQRNDLRGARKNLILTFAVPILLHGTNDFLAFAAESKQAGITEGALQEMLQTQNVSADVAGYLGWFAALLLFIVGQFVFQIIIYRKALQAAKESKAADAAAAAPESL